MTYPMWNKPRTGILIDRGNGVLAFVESGPEFEALKGSAPDWHDAPISAQPLPSREEQEANRQAAFARESDPLFFQWQAGEATEAEWLSSRKDIRARYPYPE